MGVASTEMDLIKVDAEDSSRRYPFAFVDKHAGLKHAYRIQEIEAGAVYEELARRHTSTKEYFSPDLYNTAMIL